MEEVTPSPYFTVTPDNHAGWLVVGSIIFLIYAAMGVIGKIILRVNVTVMRAPDFMLVASLVLLLIETALVIEACNNGLGQHSSALPAAQFDTFAKYFYAASMLGVFIQAMTKLSICLLISAISPDKKLLLANNIVMSIIAIWAITSIFSMAFACGLPTPWRENGDGICEARRSLEIYNGVLNILTDLAICVLPIAMMWDVRTTLRRKIQVCALFGCRIVVPSVTIPALATSRRYYENILTDPTWYAIVPIVLAQISLCLSVLTACVPGLKSILENLVSGMMAAKIQNDYDLTNSGDKKSPFILTPHQDSNGQSKMNSGSKSRSGYASIVAQKLRLGNSQHTSSVTGGGGSHVPRRSKSDGGQSTSESTRNLTEGVIVRTDHYEVSSVQRQSVSYPDSHSRQSREGLDEITQINPRL